jgi:hypothetical protein
VSGRPPFDGIDLLVIDGNNLLHRTAGGLGPRGRRREAGPGPEGPRPGGYGPGGFVSGPAPSSARILIPRLRTVLPADVRAALILDGMPDPGAPSREHIGSITIAHAGRRSADDAIVEAVEQRPYEERSRTIVVTDDRGLAERVKRLGALHRRVRWLQDVLELAHRGPRSAVQAPIGRPGVRPPRATPPTSEPPSGQPGDDAERTPWTPGRGATRKRGNPMRRRSRPGR